MVLPLLLIGAVIVFALLVLPLIGVSIGFSLLAFGILTNPWVKWILIVGLGFYIFQRTGLLQKLRGVVHIG